MTQEKLLGEGSFGKVYVGQDKSTGASVAIKVLQRRGMKSTDLEFNLNEVGILSVVGSHYVPYLLDVYENFNQIFIVQEFVEGISLNQFSKIQENRNEGALKIIFKELINGLKGLHDIGVAHRDIKLDNIML
jgi:serine/threonine protein kinase